MVSYSITSLLLFSHLECKGFVLGPFMSALPLNVCAYSITSSLLCCHLELGFWLDTSCECCPFDCARFKYH